MCSLLCTSWKKWKHQKPFEYESTSETEYTSIVNITISKLSNRNFLKINNELLSTHPWFMLKPINNFHILNEILCLLSFVLTQNSDESKVRSAEVDASKIHRKKFSAILNLYLQHIWQMINLSQVPPRSWPRLAIRFIGFIWWVCFAPKSDWAANFMSGFASNFIARDVLLVASLDSVIILHQRVTRCDGQG